MHHVHLVRTLVVVRNLRAYPHSSLVTGGLMWWSRIWSWGFSPALPLPWFSFALPWPAIAVV